MRLKNQAPRVSNLAGILVCWGVAGGLYAADVIENGSFEVPDIPGDWLGVPQGDVDGWSTTSPSGEIEIWTSGFMSVPAFAGNQFSEMNRNENDTLYQEVSGIPAGAEIDFSLAHRRRSDTNTMQMRITDLGADNTVGGGDDTEIFLSPVYTSNSDTWTVHTNPSNLFALGNTIRFAYEALTPTSGSGNFLDGVVVDVNQEVCRIIRLESDSKVAPAGQDAPTKTLLGTGELTVSFSGVDQGTAQYEVELKTDKGSFPGQGLLYSDGDFTPNNPPVWDWPKELFDEQDPDPFETTTISPAASYGDIELAGLTLTSDDGGEIEFKAGGAYEYSASGLFASPHTGKYKTVDCANAVPAPGSLPLMGLPLTLWLLARRRVGRRRALVKQT